MSKQPRTAPSSPTPAVAGDGAAFANLLTTLFRQPPPPGKRILTDDEARKRIAMPLPGAAILADTIERRLAADEMLSPYQYGMLAAGDRILGMLFALPAFHPQLAGVLREFRGILVAQALPADGWITNPRHPVRQLLDVIYLVACSWQPETEAAAKAARVQAESWLSQLSDAGPDCSNVADSAKRWLYGQQQRRGRLENRVLAAESGALQSRRARQVAARTLNQALAAREIDVAATRVIRKDWFAAMQWVLLSEGEQSPLWQRMKRTTGSLRWTLSPEADDDGNARYPRVLAQVRAELEALAALVFRDNLARDRLLTTIDSEHLRILGKLPRKTAPFAPVDAGDAVGDGTAEVSETLLAGVRALEQGQWLLLQEPQGSRRVRLLLRQEDSRQLLFANALGGKGLACSWEACALRLANGSAVPLPLEIPLQDCIAAVIRYLDDLRLREQQEHNEALRSARETAEAEARSRDAARRKALAEAEVMERARLEAAQRADEARIAANREARATLQRARLQVSSLAMGAWLAFRNDDGTVIRRRLAVILPSTGKYIFVEADGSGRLELFRDDLVADVGNGRISPLKIDQRLDDTLTRIVDNLRQDQRPGDRK